MLGAFGAEVIKIEKSGEGDGARRMGPFLEDKPHPERSALFLYLNTNKKIVTLNLKSPSGLKIIKELAKTADVLVENFEPEVMPALGLDYETLEKINPRLVMTSVSGFGQSGPYRDYPAYGTTLEQHAGFSSIMGYPDSGPHRTHSTYPDPVASINAVSAIMLALWHRRRTGKGQYIDLAQIESSVCLLGEVILDYSMNKREPQRIGNRHQFMAPQGCYRCKGDDMWVAITVANDEEWQVFIKAVGNPPWTKEERFADQLNRWKNQDELDKLIGEWTIQHDHYKVMHILQKAGVAAGTALNARELLSDPQLRERKYFVEHTHPEAGTHLYPGFPVKLSKTPASF